jgi:hypothetical protein
MNVFSLLVHKSSKIRHSGLGRKSHKNEKMCHPVGMLREQEKAKYDLIPR